MDIIELRAHHLGVIYNIVALSDGMIESESAVREAIAQFAIELEEYDYPASTTEEALILFEKMFFTGCTIQIVEGPDVICTSGCIQSKRDRRSLDDCRSLAFLCQNTKSVSDQIAIRIFEVVVGRRYSSQEITRRIHELWQKHKFESRDGLFGLYMEENEEEYDRLFDECLEHERQSAWW